jgi:hypothetical protein
MIVNMSDGDVKSERRKMANGRKEELRGNKRMKTKKPKSR